MKILVINSGSSSIKYQLFNSARERSLCKGMVDRIGSEKSTICHTKGENHSSTIKIKAFDHCKAIEHILDMLVSREFGVIDSWQDIKAIGHRLVHGGERFRRPVMVDKRVLNSIEGFSELAPLHNPPAILGIKACFNLAQGIPQVAVFDTAFHQTIPDYAYIYGIPYAYYKKYKIRRYGFHGMSHKYVAHQAARAIGKRLSRLKLITCHLGNGCSITAVRHGKSIDTSMGFTPLEGLLMGTRSGDIDPAAVLYIADKKGLEIQDIDDMLNKKSGILGVSGISNDMREILRHAESGNKRAHLTLDVFIYRIKKYIGAYTAAMNGLDAVVLTGGIGENSKIIKKRIEKSLKPFFESFDASLLVIPTDEELMIAHETAGLIQGRRL
jgi:acetate kinase